jgi:hypothetical protein
MKKQSAGTAVGGEKMRIETLSKENWKYIAEQHVAWVKLLRSE